MTAKPGIRECILGGRASVAFWCKGCRTIHWVPVDGSRGWAWDRSTLTLEPSVRHFHTADAEAVKHTSGEITTCHYFVRNGQIQYLDDSSSHQLRGVHDLDEAPPENYGGREHLGWSTP